MTNRHSKLTPEEAKIVEEFGCHIIPTSQDYIRTTEEYDPQAKFFG